ncbi:MAG: hypothetical protein ACI4RO_00725 [Candidatus Scatosoma sp.]
MKKLGAIIVSALVFIVGGVYATFNYAQTQATSQEATLTKNLEAAVTETPKGTINVVSDFTVTVDDVADENVLTTAMVASGTTTVSFTPATGADADVRDNGIPLTLTVTVSGTNTYKGSDIFTTTASAGVALNGGNKVKDAITVNLADYIFVTAISLPTKAEYDAYKAAFDTVTIKITVSETPAA